MGLHDKEKLRTYCRHRLNNFEEYFSREYDDFLENLLCDVSMPFDIDKRSLYATDLQNVCSNILIEFLSNTGCIEFEPSLKACEHKLKETFLKGLETAHGFQKLKLDEVLPCQQPFNFESLLPGISKSIKQMDEFLSEGFLALIAAHFFLQSFEHLLLFDEKKLLEEETVLLLKDNNFEPLEAEVNSLSNDAKYLSQLENFIYIGLFKVDISNLVTLMKARINKTIRDSLENTILVKFQKMLEDNEEIYKTTKNSLSSSISSVDSYIEMKTLLNSREIRETIENIQSDIKLCRRINDFLETHMQHTELLIIKYLGSLNWVSVLNMKQTDARRRLVEAGPKFILELNRESEQIINELVAVLKDTKKFEAYSDLHFAEEYYSKADEINKKLIELQDRASQINKRQDILECKETSFVAIGVETKAFEKYFNLWDFIAARWAPNMNQWWKGPFHDIKHYEMKSIINYGNDLLKRLLEDFSSPSEIAIQEIIKSKQHEVSQHIEIHSNIEILKHPCFKDRHWEAFFAEIKDQDKGNGNMQQGKPYLK